MTTKTVSQRDKEKKLLALYEKKLSADGVWKSVTDVGYGEMDKDAIWNAMKMCDEADKAIISFIYSKSR